MFFGKYPIMSRRSQLSFKILLIVGVLFISFLPHVTLVNVIDLDYCPREGTQYYKNLEWKHCRSLQRLHCQKDASSNVVSFCHTPVLCGKGTFAKLGPKSESIICEACPEGSYQYVPRLSYEFPTTRCLSDHHPCHAPGKKLCEVGSALRDYRCMCDYKQGYAPSSAGCVCFTYNEHCACKPKSCGQGTQLNSTFQCAAIPTTPTTTTTTTTTATTNSNSETVIPSQSTTAEAPLSNGKLAGIAVGVFILLVAGVIMLWCCKGRPSFKDFLSCRNCSRSKYPAPSDSTNVNLLSDVNPTTDDSSSKPTIALDVNNQVTDYQRAPNSESEPLYQKDPQQQTANGQKEVVPIIYNITCPGGVVQTGNGSTATVSPVQSKLKTDFGDETVLKTMDQNDFGSETIQKSIECDSGDETISKELMEEEEENQQPMNGERENKQPMKEERENKQPMKEERENTQPVKEETENKQTVNGERGGKFYSLKEQKHKLQNGKIVPDKLTQEICV